MIHFRSRDADSAFAQGRPLAPHSALPIRHFGQRLCGCRGRGIGIELRLSRKADPGPLRRARNRRAMEWMAVPFYDTERQRVQAVLFLDANVRGFLTLERQELVLAVVRGIAVFIGKRYA
jgi:hypothetical protein